MNKSFLNISILTLSLVILLGCENPANVESKGIKQDSVHNPSATPEVTHADTNPENIPSEGTNLEILSPKVKPSGDKNKETEKEVLIPSDFMSAQWTDLLPKDDLDALLNPPEYLNEIPENSAGDQLSDNYSNNSYPKKSDQGNELNGNSNNEALYHQALASTRIISAVNNVAVKMPTFIVPLEFDDEQKVTQFFMVPYFGACMHLPPPPPNQTIFVNYPQGFALDSITEPYWVSGVLKTSLVENETATAAYTLDMHFIEKYDE